ncbi:hypothetical protein M5K25_023908 [Dendrobium thyrsiflorum]|uniref:Uncharacterized protein n=1 Tax=Dendrobium thyrsiflorum TaxID=117978 RepID=A0ABD0U0U5_DENTH
MDCLIYDSFPPLSRLASDCKTPLEDWPRFNGREFAAAEEKNSSLLLQERLSGSRKRISIGTGETGGGLGDFSLLRFAPLFSKGSEMGDPSSSKNPPEDRPAHRSEGSKKIHKKSKTDDAISTITEDSFISFRKKFHFPNDLVMKVSARSDRARFPPPGYVTVYKFSLRAGLRLPPAPELIDILTICGVSIFQFSYRAMSIIMGLIVLFRDHRVVLSSKCLSWMGRLFSDVQGRISFKSKWLDIRARDPSKGWISNFFYVQNDWNCQEK